MTTRLHALKTPLLTMPTHPQTPRAAPQPRRLTRASPERVRASRRGGEDTHGPLPSAETAAHAVQPKGLQVPSRSHLSEMMAPVSLAAPHPRLSARTRENRGPRREAPLNSPAAPAPARALSGSSSCQSQLPVPRPRPPGGSQLAEKAGGMV